VAISVTLLKLGKSLGIEVLASPLQQQSIDCRILGPACGGVVFNFAAVSSKGIITAAGLPSHIGK
jgi:hypothetical protein